MLEYSSRYLKDKQNIFPYSRFSIVAKEIVVPLYNKN